MESILKTPPKGTHTPQSIIYEAPRCEYPKGDSSDRGGFEGNKRANSECITLKVMLVLPS